jgi:hypothetical protein
VPSLGPKDDDASAVEIAADHGPVGQEMLLIDHGRDDHRGVSVKDPTACSRDIAGFWGSLAECITVDPDQVVRQIRLPERGFGGAGVHVEDGDGQHGHLLPSRAASRSAAV